MRFAWDDAGHLFVGRNIVAETPSDRAHRDRIEQAAILDALAACTDPVPAATSSQRTAYHVLASRSQFPHSLRSGKPGRRRFWQHMEALRQMQLVEGTSIRRANRHATAILRLTTFGRANASNANSRN